MCENISVDYAVLEKAAGVVGLAAETFNDGLRAYYFAFAAAAWLFSPIAFALASVARFLSGS